MFESFRQSLRDLTERGVSPEARRAGLSEMKQTLVLAKMGLDDLRAAVATTRQRLEAERRELATMTRRKALATGINDAETLALAEKYEAHHTERAAILGKKLEAQEAELAATERDVEEMTAALKSAVAGVGPAPSRSALDEAKSEVDELTGNRGSVEAEIDALRRASARAEREAEADRQLAELKRRMGR